MKSKQMVLLDCIMRFTLISEVQKNVQVCPLLITTVPEDEINLLNLYSSITSQHSLIDHLNVP